MSTRKAKMSTRSWTRDNFLISTDPTLLPISTLVDVFGSDDFYWAKSIAPDVMQEMINNSLCFGLFESSNPKLEIRHGSEHKLVGFARSVTDFVTFAYITDVWVDSARQGEGLGSWLIQCVQEVVEDMPDLRRSLLFTADWSRSVPFYEKLMGMRIMENNQGQGLAIMEKKGRGHPSYGKDGSGY
ncbi:hypothetical protein F5X68DRAFT_178239 [Plectosphaerella plurivora]|uniref:N-acetyltransferase domain-containing protein n=1 Tax=Plectosphaerella plurivora TaxID=936078 RepID=A0A9P9A3C4_9PEZI|nr:hypothetical protein F5X68DRAFT_178239 [Plectosphaerella plurivora]